MTPDSSPPDERKTERRPQSQGDPRLPHPRDLGVRHRADRHRGQVAPERQGVDQGGLRPAPERRGLPRRDEHHALRAGQPLQPRSGAHPEAAPAPAGDREADRRGGAEGAHAGPARALLQERAGQGGRWPSAGARSSTTSARTSSAARSSARRRGPSRSGAAGDRRACSSPRRCSAPAARRSRARSPSPGLGARPGFRSGLDGAGSPVVRGGARSSAALDGQIRLDSTAGPRWSSPASPSASWSARRSIQFSNQLLPLARPGLARRATACSCRSSSSPRSFPTIWATAIAGTRARARLVELRGPDHDARRARGPPSPAGCPTGFGPGTRHGRSRATAASTRAIPGVFFPRGHRRRRTSPSRSACCCATSSSAAASASG